MNEGFTGLERHGWVINDKLSDYSLEELTLYVCSSKVYNFSNKYSF